MHKGKLGANWTLVDNADAIRDPVGYLKEDGCPFAKWWPRLPDTMEEWQDNSLDKMRKTWEEKGSPVGIDENDHNFGTKLGQGNTLGFLVAKLSIDPEKLDSKYHVGVFKEAKEYPAVVRFSDFGADGASISPARMAIKFAVDNGWKKQINWLTTGTIDVFPIANYDGLTVFAGGSDATFWDKLQNAWETGTAILPRLFSISDIKNGFMFGKDYYSQLPYGMGDSGGAMRFKFVAMQDFPEEDIEANKNSRIKSVKDVIEEDGDTRAVAGFELWVQIHPDVNSDDVQTKAHKRWDHKWIKAGTLSFANQELDDDAMSVLLKDTIERADDVAESDRAGLHKSYEFHPILTTDDHRPVGQVNSFRAGYYEQQANLRRHTMHTKIKEPRRMPWKEIRRDLEELLTVDDFKRDN